MNPCHQSLWSIIVFNSCHQSLWSIVMLTTWRGSDVVGKPLFCTRGGEVLKIVIVIIVINRCKVIFNAITTIIIEVTITINTIGALREFWTWWRKGKDSLAPERSSHSGSDPPGGEDDHIDIGEDYQIHKMDDDQIERWSDWQKRWWWYWQGGRWPD